MNKRALIKKIIARLTDELEVYFRAANASRAETGNLTREAGASITPGWSC